MYRHPNNIENAESWSNTTYDEIPSICLVFWLHISIWKQHTCSNSHHGNLQLTLFTNKCDNLCANRLNVAQWLERRTGDRGLLGSNPADSTSLRNFDNYVYSTLPVSFVGDTESCRPLLSGVYARGRKGPPTHGKCNSEINHSCITGPRMCCLE